MFSEDFKHAAFIWFKWFAFGALASAFGFLFLGPHCQSDARVIDGRCVEVNDGQ